MFISLQEVILHSTAKKMKCDETVQNLHQQKLHHPNTLPSTFAPGESKKRLAFEKRLSPEYQNNNIENNLDSLPIRSIRFTSLPGLNRSFLPIDKGDFLQ